MDCQLNDWAYDWAKERHLKKTKRGALSIRGRHAAAALRRWSQPHGRRRMADRGKYRVAPLPAPTKKQYAYVPCPRSEEVGTDLALQLLKGYHHEEPETPQKSVPDLIGLDGKGEEPCSMITILRCLSKEIGLKV
ncbi:unnamed protein product [Arctia plantaginis]|uniref:Uncharacterized protein n=1 Tax=Arctia plantaginis TaxID=874455 RepID=A0A8S1B5W2_ARCPL|nr:unnamed protein product [Arctia plantaginis]